MNRITGRLLIGLWLAAGHATAQSLILTEGAHELLLQTITFPGVAAGNLIFRHCDECSADSLRITPATRYNVATGPVELEDFMLRVQEIRAQYRPEAIVPVTVYYSVDSGEVTRVALHDAEERP